MFLYVMDTESRDQLLNLGFELLKENDKKTVYRKQLLTFINCYSKLITLTQTLRHNLRNGNYASQRQSIIVMYFCCT